MPKTATPRRGRGPLSRKLAAALAAVLQHAQEERAEGFVADEEVAAAAAAAVCRARRRRQAGEG